MPPPTTLRFDWHVSDPENYDPVYLDFIPVDVSGDDA